MVKSYNTLIKISKLQLDEKRKQLAQLLDRKEGYLNQIKVMNEELRAEFSNVHSSKELDIVMRNQFLLFASSVVMRQIEYSGQADKLNPEINRLSDEIFVHFGDMKKFEIFRDRKLLEQDDLLNKKIQAELDEVGINNFIRKNKEDYLN